MQQITMNDMTSSPRWSAFERFTKRSVWPAYAGCVWAFLYAVFVRFYQAAGGTIGLSGQPRSPETGLYMASYIMGVLILICGFILLGLVKPWGRIVPAWVPWIAGKPIPRAVILIPTLLCTAFLLAHGAAGIVTRALFLASVIDIHLPEQYWIDMDLHDMALWDLLVYEPWFLMMGLLSGLTAAHYAQASGVSPSALKRSTMLYLLFVVLLTALFICSIVFDFVEKISF
ncbi:DUF3995 domain-containing protein [Paenibacillus ehimensis]|uniref:DUF3995 domain-containing protein n=1 Tax=Paenibacillus ehimensis TaxID=79264 RepID=UPI002DB7D427|nr:DUF3995 domain-containing protein [Paenibacillus ehimensis]MEC0210882.1 DUF3995 domain-containing protein [Paenibacillus ehimensis]